MAWIEDGASFTVMELIYYWTAVSYCLIVFTCVIPLGKEEDFT